MGTDRTVINAIIGAVVGVVLSFIPFSTVVGGVVAGFLEGPDPRDGAIVGALAGVITFLPIAAIVVIALGVLGIGFGAAAGPASGFAVATMIVVGIAFLIFLYTVGLSLLGGTLGAYLADEYPDQHGRARDAIGLSTDRRDAVRTDPLEGSPPQDPYWRRDPDQPHDYPDRRPRESPDDSTERRSPGSRDESPIDRETDRERDRS